MEKNDQIEVGRVLSIQSWVVHGYVGNKCASFALESLGIEVDVINTVQFSNHTGYPKFRGPVTTADEIQSIWDGLNENGLAKYACLLTGYCNDVKSMKVTEEIVDDLKQKNPGFIYACDPVMADDGKMYVKSDVLEEYKTNMLQRADLLFPNMSELELLSGISIKTAHDAKRAIAYLHQKGISTIITKSLIFDDDKTKIIIVVSKQETKSKAPNQFILKVPRIPGYYSGTGDLFAALVVGWVMKGKTPEIACQNAVCAIEQVLHQTIAQNSAELKLVQTHQAIITDYVLAQDDCRKAISWVV